MHCRTSSLMMSHSAISLGLAISLGSAQAKRVGQLGGWVHPKGANSMAVSGLGYKKGISWHWEGHFRACMELETSNFCLGLAIERHWLAS